MAILRRELAGYFYSPVAYVAMTLFLLASGLLFYADFRTGQPASMRTLFEWMVWLLVFIVPLICMGLMSQEWASGTVEPLMTAPVDEVSVVLGKFGAAVMVVMILLVPTGLYLLVMAQFSSPDYGPIVSSYAGAALVGVFFVAIGLLCSALTRSQVVAAIGTSTLLFGLTIVPWWLARQAILPWWARAASDQLVFARYSDFAKGVIDTSHVVFFVGGTVLVLFATVKVLESRRWR
jgi:ABC-2 type transport system permease protein